MCVSTVDHCVKTIRKQRYDNFLERKSEEKKLDYSYKVAHFSPLDVYATLEGMFIAVRQVTFEYFVFRARFCCTYIVGTVLLQIIIGNVDISFLRKISITIYI